jgi:hypothetical protein
MVFSDFRCVPIFPTRDVADVLRLRGAHAHYSLYNFCSLTTGRRSLRAILS